MHKVSACPLCGLLKHVTLGATTSRGHRGTAGPCGHHGWCAQSCRCWKSPMGPRGWAHMVLPLLGATGGVQQAQIVVCGQWGTGALLATVATKVGAPKAAGNGEPQWALLGAPMWSCLR